MSADWRGDVLKFWFGLEPERWWQADPELDDEVRRRFVKLWTEKRELPLPKFLGHPLTALAAVILFDQFPRNMFRGTPRAFATDATALAAARHALAAGYDRDWLPVEKIFAYLPFEHSEALADQQRACELMRPLGGEQYDYALRHKAIIERFGRFPHRNAILGRASTAAEIEFLKQPGSGF